MDDRIDKSSAVPLTVIPVCIEQFILQWGDFGGQWGVNRSISQIQALLYLSDHPIPAEDIAQILGIARSNVSNSLKELLAWRLVYRVPVKGDRRDHFIAEVNVWEIAARIAEVRKSREIDPALLALRACVADAKEDPKVSATQRKRLEAMLDFTQSVDRWYSQMLSVPKTQRDMILKLGSKIAGLLPGGS